MAVSSRQKSQFSVWLVFSLVSFLSGQFAVWSVFCMVSFLSVQFGVWYGPPKQTEDDTIKIEFSWQKSASELNKIVKKNLLSQAECLPHFHPPTPTPKALQLAMETYRAGSWVCGLPSYFKKDLPCNTAGLWPTFVLKEDLHHMIMVYHLPLDLKKHTQLPCNTVGLWPTFVLQEDLHHIVMGPGQSQVKRCLSADWSGLLPADSQRHQVALQRWHGCSEGLWVWVCSLVQQHLDQLRQASLTSKVQWGFTLRADRIHNGEKGQLEVGSFLEQVTVTALPTEVTDGDKGKQQMGSS